LRVKSSERFRLIGRKSPVRQKSWPLGKVDSSSENGFVAFMSSTVDRNTTDSEGFGQEEKSLVGGGVGQVPFREVKPLWIGNVKVDPPILQAPMAGYTNYAFRQIVRDYGGAGLQATEMVNARGFVWLDEHECEHPERLWGVRDEFRPLAVQIWDNDPDTMAKVGQRLVEEYRVSVVDINFGCPVKQVTEKAHSGSYLHAGDCENSIGLRAGLHQCQ
jgi:hypothetical protein